MSNICSVCTPSHSETLVFSLSPTSDLEHWVSYPITPENLVVTEQQLKTLLLSIIYVHVSLAFVGYVRRRLVPGLVLSPGPAVLVSLLLEED